MTSYSPQALGEVVRRLRKQRGWTQEQLGQEAGYGNGAAVAISRVETGRLPPSPERFGQIAAALGLAADELARQAEVQTERTTNGVPGSGGDLEARGSRIQREIDDRTKLVADLEQAFCDALDRAKNDFLMRLVDVAARVGAPLSDVPEVSGEEGLEHAEATTEVEAKYEIQFRRFGVARALADAAPRVTDRDAAYRNVTAAAAGATAAVGPSFTSVAAASALAEALKVRRPDARRTAIAEATTFVGAIAAQVAVATAVGLLRARRQRKEERLEISANLDMAEQGLDHTRQNVEALRELMPRATEILDHIAVHAGRALDRWEADLSQERCDWSTLDESRLRQYHDFIDIAAAQYAVAAIDFENLAKSQDNELDRSIDHAESILEESRKLVWSYV